jgi:hypothetical protein
VSASPRCAFLLRLSPVMVVAIVMAGCSTTPSPTGNPDPGHRLMSSIQPVLGVLPTDAHVTLRHASEPRWDSCDGVKSTYGWDPVTVDAEFTVDGSPAQIVSHIDSSLRAMGWVPDRSAFGDGAWYGTRTLVGGTTASAQLLGGRNAQPPDWSIQASAPPAAHPVKGC